MKKGIIIASAAILVAVVLFCGCYFAWTTPDFKGEFSVSDYQDKIANIHFQTEKNYGPVKGYKSAAKAGKAAISERFDGSEGGVFQWMGCDVRRDKEHDAYYIRTYPVNPNRKGGTYAVILGSDGTVLAIWGEK